MWLTEWLRLADCLPAEIRPSIEDYFTRVESGEADQVTKEVRTAAKLMTDDIFCDACNMRTLTTSTCLLSDPELQNYTKTLIPEDLLLLVNYYSAMDTTQLVVDDRVSYEGNIKLAKDTKYFQMLYDSCTQLPAAYIGVVSVCSSRCIFHSIYDVTMTRIEAGDQLILLLVLVTWLLHNNFLHFTNPYGPESMSHISLVNQIVKFIQYRKGKLPCLLKSYLSSQNADEYDRLYYKYINITMRSKRRKNKIKNNNKQTSPK